MDKKKKTTAETTQIKSKEVVKKGHKHTSSPDLPGGPGGPRAPTGPWKTEIKH